MAEVSRSDFKKQIKNKSFSNLYVIYGDEKIYVKQDTDLLITSLMGKEPPDFNYHSFIDDYEIDDIAEAVWVAPFVSEYNCVVVSDLDINSLKIVEFEQLEELVKNIPDTTILIFTFPTLADPDKKGKGENYYKKILNYIKKNGVVCNEKKETDISLARMIMKIADKRGIKMERADAYKFQEYVGDDLNNIKNELEKLCNYVGDNGIIASNDIEAITTKRLEANIYKLSENIISGNATVAYDIVQTLLYQKTDVEKILYNLVFAYTDYYRVRVAKESGVTNQQLAKDFNYGNRTFVIDKAQKSTARISTNSLCDSLDEIIDSISRAHSVAVNKELLLQTLIAKLILLAKG